MPTENEKRDINELMYLKKIIREKPNDIYYKNRLVILQKTIDNQFIVSSQLRKYNTVSKKTASSRSRTLH